MVYNRQQILDMLSKAIPVMSDEDLADTLNFVNACICEDFGTPRMRFENGGFTDDPLPKTPLLPYQEGGQAYWEHKTIEHCPYAPGTPSYRQWYDGWIWEQLDAEQDWDDPVWSVDGYET